MKNKIIISAIFIIPVLLYFILLGLNPDKALEEAALAQENIPKVIMFSTPMCGECQKMVPVFEQAQKNYAGKVNLVKVNAAENKPSTIKLVRKHKIFVVPTIVYLDKSGNVVNKTQGSMSYSDFDEFIKQILDK